MTIGGAAAPLFAVAVLQSYQQINFQVPYDSVYGDGQAGVYAVTLVQQNGLQGSANATVSISPGDFFQIAGQYGIFQHSKDYSLVTKDNPAKPGETLVTYLTGVVPALDFSVPAGQPAPLSPVDRVTQFGGTYNIVLNGEPIGDVGDPDAIPFFGLAPGMLGVYQINFALPSSATSGDAQIKLRLTTPAFHGVSFVTYDSYPVLFPVR